MSIPYDISALSFASETKVCMLELVGGGKAGDLFAFHGKLVKLDAYGFRDKEANVAMTTDTIFNIASMTKPITTVGALMLYEQGKLLIDDPLSKYFPKFANMKVALRDNGEPIADTTPANRQITIQDLMRHTSGIIYGGRGNTVVHKMYPAGSGDASSNYDGAAFMI